MTPFEDEAINPYQAPSSELGKPLDLSPGTVNREMVKKFRDQIHALGALWILNGLFAAGVGAVGLSGNLDVVNVSGGVIQAVLAVITVLGFLWLVVGVMACLKRMWAVYLGLGLSYLALVAQFFSFNILGFIILIVVILQAHRVIGWAKQMHAAGVPLTTRL